MQVRSACNPLKRQPLTALAVLNAFCSSAWRCCKASTLSLSSFSLASWDPRFSCKTIADVSQAPNCDKTLRSILQVCTRRPVVLLMLLGRVGAHVLQHQWYEGRPSATALGRIEHHGVWQCMGRRMMGYQASDTQLP